MRKSKFYYVMPSGMGKGTNSMKFRNRRKAQKEVGRLRRAGFKAKISRRG